METINRTCSVAGCDRPFSCKGFCRMHYKRWKRLGRAEPYTAEQRFFSHVTPTANWDDCWIWNGTICDGYGRFRIDGKDVFAHRWSYELLRAEIPPSLRIDHLCRNRACVNPWHLEPVSQRENVLRGEGVPALNARKTHCNSGHEFTYANTYVDPDGGRECRICRAARQRRFESKYK